jgi:hypothetical protein
MEDYAALKALGLMQITKIYNLLYGSRMTDSGTAGKFPTVRKIELLDSLQARSN